MANQEKRTLLLSSTCLALCIFLDVLSNHLCRQAYLPIHKCSKQRPAPVVHTVGEKVALPCNPASRLCTLSLNAKKGNLEHLEKNWKTTFLSRKGTSMKNVYLPVCMRSCCGSGRWEGRWRGRRELNGAENQAKKQERLVIFEGSMSQRKQRLDVLCPHSR